MKKYRIHMLWTGPFRGPNLPPVDFWSDDIAAMNTMLGLVNFPQGIYIQIEVLADAPEAVTEEREACAKLADNAQLEDEGHWQAREIAERLAAAIRKRGEQPADVI